ncbi:MAG TPA: 1,4-alpha-glucan branching enzyme, partial [Methylophaga sp.]|nr:1,4-alpha-glucan branching enzyme [Methylophaga sp.]
MSVNQPLSEDLIKIIEARHHDPFSVLGAHEHGKKTTVTVFLRDTQKASLNNELKLKRIEGTDLFQWTGKTEQLEKP